MRPACDPAINTGQHPQPEAASAGRQTADPAVCGTPIGHVAGRAMRFRDLLPGWWLQWLPYPVTTLRLQAPASPASRPM